MENRHTKGDLAQMQSLPLKAKIAKTKKRITEWYNYYDGNVYVSFSGGKDSTVLLHIARQLYSDIPAVFCDTRLEYPEIRQFVKQTDNVIELNPEMGFKEVIETYGYPFPSKEVAQIVTQAKIGLNGGGPRGGKYQSSINKLRGCHLDKNGNKSNYNCKKWEFLLEAPFNVSHECCNIMKKKPFKDYERISGNKPILAVMASESSLRKNSWIRYGCNSFTGNRVRSWPMAFWTENDVLEYLVTYNVPYASCYGDIVLENGKYKTTKCERTGCIFCMFGCHLEKEPNRFQKLKESHPELYDYCMRSKEEKGLGLAEVLDYLEVKY